MTPTRCRRPPFISSFLPTSFSPLSVQTIHLFLLGFTMEVASRNSSRLLRAPSSASHATKLLLRTQRHQPLPLRSIATTNTLNRIRHVSTTSRSLAPEPSFMNFSSSSSGSGSPTSYFASRPSLPANTIIRFVPQQTAWIVERMGKFHRILEPGLAILIPFIDRIAYVKHLKESAIEIPSQNAITADNVTLELDGVLYTRVFDAYKAR